MKWASAVLVVGLVISLGIRADDDGKADLQKLEGKWKITAIEMAGKKFDASKGGPDQVVIKDGKFTLLAGGKEMPTFKDFKLELDPKKKPKAVDMIRGEKESLPAIYEVTADELKLAMPLVPKERKPGERLPRPESFDTKDKPVMLLTAKRDKE